LLVFSRGVEVGLIWTFRAASGDDGAAYVSGVVFDPQEHCRGGAAPIEGTRISRSQLSRVQEIRKLISASVGEDDSRGGGRGGKRGGSHRRAAVREEVEEEGGGGSREINSLQLQARILSLLGLSGGSEVASDDFPQIPEGRTRGGGGLQTSIAYISDFPNSKQEEGPQTPKHPQQNLQQPPFLPPYSLILTSGATLRPSATDFGYPLPDRL